MATASRTVCKQGVGKAGLLVAPTAAPDSAGDEGRYRGPYVRVLQPAALSGNLVSRIPDEGQLTPGSGQTPQSG
jgi:hypothetical protein